LNKFLNKLLDNENIDIVEEIIEHKTKLEKQYDKKNRINKELKCPMNNLFDVDIKKYKSEDNTLSMDKFFIKFKINSNERRRKSKKVEELIQKYSFKLYNFNTDDDMDDDNIENYLLLRSDFEEMIDDIRKLYISNNYLGLFSWLLDRGFMITPNIQSNNNNIKTNIDANKSILLKTLYDINPKVLLQCFSKK